MENVLKIEEEAKIANQKVLTTKILGVLRNQQQQLIFLWIGANSKFTNLDSLIRTIVWRFQDFPAIQILREIRFGNFRVSKTAILTFLEAQNLDVLEIFCTFKCGIFIKIKFQCFQNCQKFIFDTHESSKFDFT